MDNNKTPTENKKGLNLVFLIVALILGGALWKQFDATTYKFEKPALAALYFIVFAVSVFLLVRDLMTRSKS